jgi:putative transposase
MGDTLHRSARIAVRATKPQRRRLYGLLRSAGDVRALVLDCNRQLRE